MTTPDHILPPPLQDTGPLETMAALIEAIARAIADGIGDDFDHAHRDKPHWIETRGESGGRYRDINEPRQPDFIDAARAALTAITEAGCTIVSKDDFHELLRTANDAREALDNGTRYERGAGGMTIDAQVARTVIGNVPARIVEPLHMAIAAFGPIDSEKGE